MRVLMLQMDVTTTVRITLPISSTILIAELTELNDNG